MKSFDDDCEKTHKNSDPYQTVSETVSESRMSKSKLLTADKCAAYDRLSGP